jgi:methylamine dehydrogenase light chain
MDSLVEQLTRTVAQRTSRRGFLARMGKLMLGGMVLPLLPIDRVMGTAQAQMTMGPSGTGRTDDPSTCDYWRYCGFDGNLCGCCGGSHTECPAGTIMSPTSWVGTCRDPNDGKEYIIGYRDCCGKDVCGRCFCENNKGALPSARGWREHGASGRQSDLCLELRRVPSARRQGRARGLSAAGRLGGP